MFVMPITDDLQLANWIAGLHDRDLDRFIDAGERLLATEDGMLTLAWLVGAARRWRDEMVDPLDTLRENAPDDFYEDGR